MPTPNADAETQKYENAELRSQFKRKQISELKEECRAKGVKVTGLKDNLIDRLVEMANREAGQEEPSLDSNNAAASSESAPMAVPGTPRSRALTPATQTRERRSSRSPRRGASMNLVCLTTIVAEDGELEIQGLADESDTVLLMSGRNEINKREAKWQTSAGRAMIKAGMDKEIKNVIKDKSALEPMTLQESERVWLEQPERVVDSRMILTEKLVEKADGSEEAIVKARWCGKGFTDPDLKMMLAKGETASPTLSTSGFWLVLQVLASMRSCCRSSPRCAGRCSLAM
jgi:hypothetical protein